MEISTGKINAPVKVLIYGPEGIGKTTFASRFPRPLFIDTEGSTTRMDVRRLPRPDSWMELINEVNWVLANPDSCQTLVIDTGDWAEILCNEHICARDKKTGIEDYGYGKGYQYAMEEFSRLPTLLDQVVGKGIHAVVCCHAQMRKFEQPDELGTYDRWELKMSKKVSPLLREWADMVLFANYKTIVVNVDGKGATKGKNKAQGGKRVMYTSHHPCWDAKNRFSLPEEMDFDYEGIRAIVEGVSTDSSQLSAASGQQPAASKTENGLPRQAGGPPRNDTGEGDGSGSGSALARKVEQAVQPKAADTAPPVPDPADPYPFLPGTLSRLMQEAEVTPDEVRYVIAQKGIYPAATPWPVICEDAQFMNGWLLHPDVWPQVVEAVKTNRTDEEVPF